MKLLQRLIRGDDLCAIIFFTCLLAAVGSHLTHDRPRVRKVGVASGFAAALAWAGYAWVSFKPATPTALPSLALRCLLAGFFGTAAAWIVFGILTFIAEHTLFPLGDARRRWLAEQQRLERERQLQAELQERERAERELARLQEELAKGSTPPPPTPEELAANALRKYEAKRRLLQAADLDEIERRSALERAKQQYLKELSEVLK